MAEKDLGLKRETIGALTYVLGPITGIFFLVISKDPFVRFHAMQSTVVFIILFVLRYLFMFVSFLLGTFVSLVIFVLWLILIYKAWQGGEWQVPVLGKVAENLLKKA